LTQGPKVGLPAVENPFSGAIVTKFDADSLSVVATILIAQNIAPTMGNLPTATLFTEASMSSPLTRHRSAHSW
jgi:hypothetical protein